MKVVGIEHEWWPEDEWFRATRVSHWLQLVADDHAGLRPLIDLALLVATPE